MRGTIRPATLKRSKEGEHSMLKKDAIKNSDRVKLTFVLPFDPARPKVSVVGDFNGWDPAANRMGKRNNGTLSTSVTLAAGQKLRFRYFTPDGQWFNDESADAYEPGEFGEDNSVVYV
jgi:1,4-alpha-glucan branching enzyme